MVCLGKRVALLSLTTSFHFQCFMFWIDQAACVSAGQSSNCIKQCYGGIGEVSAPSAVCTVYQDSGKWMLHKCIQSRVCFYY
jgi:hypothetical protein